MTTRSYRRFVWLTIIGVPILFAAIIPLQRRIDTRFPASAAANQELLLPSGPILKKLSLGYESLLADIYWTRTVQYWAAQLDAPRSHFDLLWPLLDITTTLDPHLIVAYRFGAIFLSEPSAGAGRADLAVELVKRGIEANPQNWHLQFDLGFLNYWYLHNYKDSAAAYFAGSKDPGAPASLAWVAAQIAAKGGSTEMSQMIWSEIFHSTQDPSVRKKALEHLEELRTEADEQALDKLAEEFHRKFGRYPASTAELRDAGLIQGIPRDFAGFPYEFSSEGKAHPNPESPAAAPIASNAPRR